MSDKPKTLADAYPVYSSNKPKLVVVMSGHSKAPSALTDTELVEAIAILTAEHKKRVEEKKE